MKFMRKYKNAKYYGFETGNELIEAIKSYACDDMLDELSKEFFIWVEEYSDDIQKIVEYLDFNYTEWDKYFWDYEKLKNVKKHVLLEGALQQNKIFNSMALYYINEEYRRNMIRGDGEKKAS